MKNCGTVSANKITISTNIVHLQIKININGKMRIAMIDSGIIGSFMIRKYTENKRHFIRDKQ